MVDFQCSILSVQQILMDMPADPYLPYDGGGGNCIPMQEMPRKGEF